MASQILENDSMFSAHGIRPWHGLGTVIDDAPSSEDAIRIAGLDWSIEQVQIYAGTKEVDGYFGNVRSDTKECVGIITDKYKIVQNSEAFSFVDDIMAQKDLPCKYETAGSLFNGRRVWMLVEMPTRTLLGDEVKNYLWVSNSHDGTSSMKAGISPIRVVCNNTLTAALNSSPRVWSFRHMGDLENRKREAMETLGLATDYLDELESFAEMMASKKVNIIKFVDKLFPIDEEATDRQIFTIEEEKRKIISLSEVANISNFKGTAWGAWNAVADHISNSDPKRKTDTLQRSKFVDFMDGSKLLVRAQKILTA